MSFKEQMKQDMDIFLSCEEFAETHEYNGLDIPVIVDEDKLMELKLRENEHSDGIFQGQKLLYLKDTDVNTEPFEGQRITFDGEMYRVNSVEYANSMYTVILEDYQS